MFVFRKSVTPSPIDNFGHSVSFEFKIKYLGIYLDSTVTFKMHFGYAIQKNNKVKFDLAHFLYSNEMGTANKVLLFKTALRAILLYSAVVWGVAVNSNIQKLRITSSLYI